MFCSEKPYENLRVFPFMAWQSIHVNESEVSAPLPHLLGSSLQRAARLRAVALHLSVGRAFLCAHRARARWPVNTNFQWPAGFGDPSR